LIRIHPAAAAEARALADKQNRAGYQTPIETTMNGEF
jgi:hypothetical protein